MAEIHLQTEKSELLREIAANRALVTLDTREARDSLNFPRKIRQNIRRNSTTWVMAAALVGMVFSIRRQKPVKDKRATKKLAKSVQNHADAVTSAKKETNLLFQSLMFIFPLVKPLLLPYLTKQISMLSEKLHTRH